LVVPSTVTLAVTSTVSALHPVNVPEYNHIVRRVYSGKCICGHDWTDHHLQMVQDPAVAAILGKWQDPEACDFFGADEDKGLDDAGAPHCFRYVDKDDPDPAVHARWQQQLAEVAERRRRS
jgi:hypothetical protein